jgi:hypothetical protein
VHSWKVILEEGQSFEAALEWRSSVSLVKLQPSFESTKVL